MEGAFCGIFKALRDYQVYVYCGTAWIKYFARLQFRAASFLKGLLRQ